MTISMAGRPPIPGAAAAPQRRKLWRRHGRRLVLVALLVPFFWVTWQVTERHVTWYLAVDQFGYLTFASDLLAGRVFHQWKPLEALGAAIPQRTDVLAQTYVRDGDVLYCRYAPGFAMILAGWMGLFGTEAAHLLNPVMYLVLLGATLLFQWRVFRSPWRATAGTALIALFPTNIHLWGLTLTRDLAAHLAAFVGLFLMLPARGRPLGWQRGLAAGLVLGFAVCIRPDGVLYVVAACAMALVRWRREHAPWRQLARAAAAGALGLVVGASPFLAYNWAATGNPFLPTQGMELSLLPAPPPKPAAAPPPTQPTEQEDRVAYPSAGWRGGTHMDVQGGGLRLSNLQTTLPGNWKLLVLAHSPALLGIAGWGVLVGFLRWPVFATGAVTYCLLAFPFYSCWPRPDGRYLVGVFLFVPMFIVAGSLGVLDAVRMLALRHRRRDAARVAAAAGAVLLAAAASGLGNASGSSLRAIVPAVAGICGGAALVACALPRRRLAGWTALALAACLIWIKIDRVRAEGERRAPFQRAQMYEARANMQRLLEPGSVVITSEETGRPAENIEFYSGRAHAFYLTDLQRWRLSPAAAVRGLLVGGQRPYLYLPPSAETERIIAEVRALGIEVVQVADIRPRDAMAHFVAAPFHRGMRMALYRTAHPWLEEAGRALRRGQPLPPPPPGMLPPAPDPAGAR